MFVCSYEKSTGGEMGSAEEVTRTHVTLTERSGCEFIVIYMENGFLTRALCMELWATYSNITFKDLYRRETTRADHGLF